MTPDKYPYRFRWANNPKRETLKSRRCRIVAKGGMGSVLVEFEDGQREIVSWRSLSAPVRTGHSSQEPLVLPPLTT
jgi:hypothetical protein